MMTIQNEKTPIGELKKLKRWIFVCEIFKIIPSKSEKIYFILWLLEPQPPVIEVLEITNKYEEVNLNDFLSFLPLMNFCKRAKALILFGLINSTT